MIQTVQTGSAPSIERSPELEVFISEENVVDGISDAPTTCTFALGVATSLTARCWSAVRDGVLAVWKSLVGMTTWVWNCAILLVHKRTTVERLEDLRASVEELDRCRMHGRKDFAAALSSMIAAYDALPDCLKKEMSKMIQALKEVSDENVSDIVFVSLLQGINLESVIDDLYECLPSVRFGHMEAELVRATNDVEQLRLLVNMQNIEISDLEPELTTDILDKYLRVLFDGLDDAFKETIYTEIRHQALVSLPYAPHGSQLYSSIKIDGRMINLNPLDSGSVIFRHSPRSFAVRRGMVMLQMRLNDERRARSGLEPITRHS